MKPSEIFTYAEQVLSDKGLDLNGITLKAKKISIEIYKRGDDVILEFVGERPLVTFKRKIGFFTPKITMRASRVEFGKNSGKIYADDFPLGYGFDYE